MGATKRRRLPGLVRWLHTYVSLLGFATLLFFSVTGITLNHASYFESGAEAEREVAGELPAGMLPADGSVDRLALVEYLRAEFDLRGAVEEFEEESDAISIVFKGPSSSADVRIDRVSAQASIYELRLGTWALVDDLHKGRNSGTAWSWVIDVSAVVLIVASLTGLWLLFYVRRRRIAGTLVAVAGTVALALVYALWVP